MIPVKCYASHGPTQALIPYQIQRRSPGPHDVEIDIRYCGVCHSDIHQARDEWGGSIFPMVPGHEIVGLVASTGANVTRFRVGDRVGVGCMVDSCRECASCQDGLEQFCEKGSTLTYNARERDGKTPTYGGYSERIVVDEKFVLSIPESLSPSQAAPLLCAGITTYSPFRHWNLQPGQRVAVVGLGGLGHMAVKIAAAMGAEVTVLSHSERKRADAIRLGAHEFHSTHDQGSLGMLASRFDLIIDTVSAAHDWNLYLGLLRRDATMVLVGAPPDPLPLQAFSLIGGRRRIAGSPIGGIPETQEMLDFCGKHGVVSEIELIPIAGINDAYERMLKGDVRFRFVIDLATL